MPKKTARRKVGKSVKKSAKKKVARKKARKVGKKAVRRPAAAKKKAPKAKPKMKAMPAAKPARPVMAKPAAPAIAEQQVGIVTHYYNHLNVAVVKLDQGALQVGDRIHIKGHTTDLQQRVDSMEVEHQPIQRADMGQEFGLKVADHVREHDLVYRIIG